jgi:chromosome segregation ATPase
MYFENFVTYDHCEIYPGPHMNMVMGPNGSGKSSIVAAMAIGMGWAPNVLGRAKDVTEFIKYNTDRAVLEIVLRIDPDCDKEILDDEGQIVRKFDWNAIGIDDPDGFICIRREIFRNRTKQSDWRLNGKASLAKHVENLVKELNIQINNLCQFLPQDRVSDFAKMTPIELLMETEKAAASIEVSQLHQKLIDNRKIVRDFQHQVSSEVNRLESLKKQATTLDEALERHREYQEHLAMVNYCERKRPWLEYNEARDEYLRKKDAKEKARKEFDEKIGHTEPLKKKLAELNTKSKSLRNSRASETSKLDKKQKLLENVSGKEIADLEAKIQAKRNEFFAIKRQKEKKKNDIVELRQSIRNLEEEVSNAPSNEAEETSIKEELGNLIRQCAEIDRNIQEIEGNKMIVQREASSLHQELESLSIQMSQLDNAKVQRLNVLANYNRLTVEAYHWYQEHKDEFQTKIYGPIIVDIDVPLNTVAPLVEDAISKNILMSFVSTSDQDSERFLARLEKEKNIRVNMITIDMNFPLRYRFGEEINTDLKSCGFEKMAIEYVQAPEAVLRALVENGHLDKVPIAPRGLVKSLHSISENSLSGILKLITNEDRYEIKRSRYSAEPVIKSSGIKRSEYLSKSFNQNAKAQLQSQIEEIRGNQKNCETRMHQLVLQQEPFKTQMQQLMQRQNVLHERRTELINLNRGIKISRGKLDRDKQRLRAVADSLNELQEEPIREELRILFKERKAKTIRIMSILKEYKKSLTEVLEGHVEYFLQMAEITTLETQINELERQHENLKISLNLAHQEYQVAKDNAKKLLSKANETPIDEELRVRTSRPIYFDIK